MCQFLSRSEEEFCCFPASPAGGDTATSCTLSLVFVSRPCLQAKRDVHRPAKIRLQAHLSAVRFLNKPPNMLSLRAFVSERLTAAAEEIFDAVEKTIAEYKEEIFRLKDLEISRLKMELKLLKSESGSDTCLEAQLLKHTQQHHPPSPPSPPGDLQHHHSSPAGSVSEPQSYEDPGDSSSMDQEQAEPSRIKREQDKIPRHFWMHHDAEDMDDLEPDFISTPSGLKTSMHDQTLHYHPFLDSSISEESKDNNKPYCCSVCEKRFSNCSHLAAHIRTHTGERPYKCEICHKTFITTSALNRHQTIHTEGKRFVCTNCGKSFKWMESLGRHMRSVHKNDNIPE